MRIGCWGESLSEMEYVTVEIVSRLIIVLTVCAVYWREFFFNEISTYNWDSKREDTTWYTLHYLNRASWYRYVRVTKEIHTLSHLFIPVKLSSTCFEQIIVYNQEVISVHVAYSILSRICGCLDANTVSAAR